MKRRVSFSTFTISYLSHISQTVSAPNLFRNFNETTPHTHACRCFSAGDPCRSRSSQSVPLARWSKFSLVTLLSRSLINAPRIILYFDGDEFLANRFARMETFRITRGRSAIASRDTSAPPSRSLNGFIGFRTHERTIGAVNASYLSFSSVN